MMRVLRGGAWILVALSAACSALPPSAHPRSSEHDVQAFYSFDEGPAPVRIPASMEGLQILDLTTEPSGLRESFRDGLRYVHPVGESLTVRCRYRVFEQREPDGRALPMLSPADLFPGAAVVRSLPPAK